MVLRLLLLMAIWPSLEGAPQVGQEGRERATAGFFNTSDLGYALLLGEGGAVDVARASEMNGDMLFAKFGTRFENAYDISPSLVLQSTSAPFRQATFAYATAVCAVATLIGIIYGSRGAGVCVAIECYILSLSMMTLLIRTTFVTYSFPYPKWVTATHFLATATVSGCGLLLRRDRDPAAGSRAPRVPDLFTMSVGVLPVAGVFAASIAFANQSLLHANAHFFEMFSSLGLLVTAGLGTLLGRPFKAALGAPLLALTAGLFIVSIGEVEYSWMGIFLIAVSMMFRSAKAQLQAMLLSGSHGFVTLDPMALVFWTSASCIFILVPWSLATEGAAPYQACTRPGVPWALSLGMVNASFLNIASLFVLKEIGPVAQQAVGNFKSILACFFAVVAFSEAIQVQQVIGYGIVIAACTWYNHVDMQKPKKQEEGLTAGRGAPGFGHKGYGGSSV